MGDNERERERQRELRRARHATFRLQRLQLLLLRLDELSDDALLSVGKTGAVLDASVYTLRDWRQVPDHPLHYVRSGRRVKYRLGSVRAYARGELPAVPRPTPTPTATSSRQRRRGKTETVAPEGEEPMRPGR